MRCIGYKKLLVPYYEGALDERTSRAVERHLSACSGCAADLEDIRAVSQTLRSAQIPAVEPANDLWSKVSARIADRRVPARRRWFGLPGFAYALAGTALAAVVGFQVMHTSLRAPHPADPAHGPSAQSSTRLSAPQMAAQPPGGYADNADTQAAEPGSTPPARQANTGSKPTAGKPEDSLVVALAPPPSGNSLRPQAQAADAVTAQPDTAPQTELQKSAAYSYAQEDHPGLASAPPPHSDTAAEQDAAGLNNRARAVGRVVGEYAAGPLQAFVLAPGVETAEALADADAESGELEARTAQYQATLILQPDHQPALFYLLAAYGRGGDPARAISIAQRLLQIRPDDPLLWLRLGELNESAGNTDRAREAYLKAASCSDPQAADEARRRLRSLEPH